MKQSERHDEAASFIAQYQQERGYAPSRRELAKGLGMGLATAQQIIADLIEEGLLETTPGIARSTRFVTRSVMKHGEVTM